MPLWCTKRSLPESSGVMNPKPLSSLNHLTVPVAILIFLPGYVHMLNVAARPARPEQSAVTGTVVRLWDCYRRDGDRSERVVQRRRLGDSRGRDDVHGLRHRVRIHGAVRVGTRSGADAALEVLRRRLEAARLVAAEAVLACQHHRKAPAASG